MAAAGLRHLVVNIGPYCRDHHEQVRDQIEAAVERVRATGTFLGTGIWVSVFEARRELLVTIVKHAGVREACQEMVNHNGSQIRITIAVCGASSSSAPSNRFG